MGQNAISTTIKNYKAEIVDKNGELRNNSETSQAQSRQSESRIDDIYATYDPQIEDLKKEARATEETVAQTKIGEKDSNEISQEEYKKLMDEANDLEDEENRLVEQETDERNRQETQIQTENEMIQSQVDQMQADTESLEETRTDDIKGSAPFVGN